jgi:uncharacterized membrane protein (DUF441 family)
MPLSPGVDGFIQSIPTSSLSPGVDGFIQAIPSSSLSPGVDGIILALPWPLYRSGQIQQTELAEDRLANVTSRVISTIPSIDLTATGITTLYTAPASKTALIFGVILQATAADTITVAPQVSAGLNPSTDNIFAVESLVGLTTVGGTFVYWANLNKAVTVSNGGVLDLNVSVASTATALMVTARVIAIIS